MIVGVVVRVEIEDVVNSDSGSSRIDAGKKLDRPVYSWNLGAEGTSCTRSGGLKARANACAFTRVSPRAE